MIIRVCAFTAKGNELADKIGLCLKNDIVEVSHGKDYKEFIKKSFEIRCPIIFVGACGIAVREIAPYINDKLTDSPVLCLDEKGQYVIPILSGHMGGANRLAVKISDMLGAQAVITTATDVEGVFSVDVFARLNHLGIVNREGIRKVSEKALAGEKITIWNNEKCPTDKTDVLISSNRDYDNMALLALCPKRFFLGIGCKKETPYRQIEKLANAALQLAGIDYKDVALVASIDIKRREYGLNEFAHRHNLDFVTFAADELKNVPGEYTESQFVKDITGVDNVCERSAVLAAGNGSVLVVKKIKCDGVTVAIAYNESPQIDMSLVN